MKKRSKLTKYLLLAGVIVIMAATVPGVMAFEGHVIDVTAHVKGEIQCGVTRTPGWWSNRPDAIRWVLINRITGNSFNMGWPSDDVDSVEKIMGIFWADQTKEMDCNDELITPPTRSPLCKEKAKASFQLVAAILTSYCEGGMPLPLSMSQIQAIMSGTDKSAVSALHDQIAAFNRSFDTDTIPLGIPDSELGNVDSTTARLIAWEQFANCAGPPTCP
ncbi:MAG: hypothetical protein JW762_15930 [Dehalococcoidales bacterium]|nr:hypothetical protein [Dehalococcoidales bacterium]